MAESRPCPKCGQEVESDSTMDVDGTSYTVFCCPRCTEKIGTGREVWGKLTFACGPDGKILRLRDMADLLSPIRHLDAHG